MQNKSTTDWSFEDDSNLRGIPNQVTKQKPDSYYLQEVNQIWCKDSNILAQDKNDKNTFYCFSNGEKKKLVEWKKVDDLWIPRRLTHTSEYKEVNGNVCKIMTPGCDSKNPSQNCVITCFNNDKTTNSFTANYQSLPN